MSSIPKVEETVTIGGVEYVIHKLKAGKFYEAQKIFAEIMSSLSISGKESSDDKEGESTELERAMAVMSKFPEKIATFVAFCMDLDKAELLEKAYPEEITKTFEVCINLNNVMENLKNSVAPMEKLMGAEETTVKE